MLFNVPTITIAALITAAFATPTPQDSNGQCNTGQLVCCDNTQNTSPDPKSFLGSVLSLLDLSLGSADLPIGQTCSPISVSAELTIMGGLLLTSYGIQVIGAGGSSCTTQPVCCENNNFSEFIQDQVLISPP